MEDIVRLLSLGRLVSYLLPDAVSLWDLLGEGLVDLLHHSIDVKKECGACIVLREGRLYLDQATCGWQYGVEPQFTPEKYDAEKRDFYVGFAHIHLPDDETGLPFAGFSELDFRATLVDGDNLALVYNGSEVFALVRTADCTQPRRVPDLEEVHGWRDRYAEITQHLPQEITSNPEARDVLDHALLEANLEMCQLLGFAFYYGPHGQVLKVRYRPRSGQKYSEISRRRRGIR